MRRVWAVAAIVLAVGGCGSDGDPGWSSKANAICRQALAEPPAYGEPGQFLARQLAVATDQVTALRRIDPPARVRKDWDRYLSAVARRRDVYARARLRASADALGAMETVSSNDAIYAAEARAARALGLSDCVG